MKRQLLMSSRQLGRLAIENGPTILTVCASIGVIATAVCTGKAVLKADKALERLEYTADTPPTKKEKVKTALPHYIPPFLVGAATITCIVGAHKMHLSKQAAAAAAYALMESRYSDYREKIIEELGEKKEEKIHDQIAQETVLKNPPGENGLNVIRTRFGDILFMDSFSGRYFYSSYEAVEKAKIRITQIAQSEICVSLNDFYQALEIPQTEGGSMLGWNISDISDQTFENVVPIITNRVVKTPTPEELPCVVIDYLIEPIVDFDRCI